ncbi:TlpA family protein disulfide reductase [Pirellulaceae bacterium SH449]
MWRISIYLLMVVALGGLCHRISQAQDSVHSLKKSLEKHLQPPHSVASFIVSLSPANASVGEEVTLEFRVSINKGWHIGATTVLQDSVGFPTEIEFVPTGLEPIEREFECSVEPSKLTLAAGTQLLMDGEFSWTRKFCVTSTNADYGGSGSVRFQACDDTKCLPPQTIPFDLGIAQSKAPTQNAPDATSPERFLGDPIVLTLEKCELTRTRPQLGNIVSILVFGRPTEKMVWKGTFSSGPNRSVAIYLPKTRKYSLSNTGSDGTIVNNTATYVSVDQNGDGELADWEACGANRPIRIRDTMYRIKDIDTDKMTLTLQQLDMPLKGSLIGFRCPDFEYTTVDGASISNKSILGKVTVLDIWAVSCHNCYEGFPNLQKAMDKHTAEKLQVVLLTVDENLQYYDSQAPKLFETYGGGTWPQVMIPGGFEGALALGDYGFGSIVVDEAGIVRAVGVHGHNIEAVIDTVVQ